MEKSLTMPKLGMTMTEGTVLQWLYQEGDFVEKGEPLLEVMTDKVNIEVEAPYSGQLAKILAHDGETLPVGAPLATLVDETTSSISPTTTVTTANTAHAASSIATVASTPAAKREAALHNINLHDVVISGAIPPLDRSDILAFVQNKEQMQRVTPVVRATPVAQKMASQHHIDLTVLAERKAGEKVTRADVEAHLATNGKNAPVEQASTTTPQVVVLSSNTSAPTGEATEYELIPLSPVRRLIGQRMQQSITTAPHIYLDTEIDMSEAERCRQRIGQSVQKQGEPAPSLTAILLRAVAAALLRHPEVNAALDNEKGKEVIRRWHAVHLGVAVDTEQALLTPVVRNAQQRTILDIARELRRLVEAARKGTLKPDEMANATFTISNLGMYGIDTFHAIIAPGQSAILAVGKVTKRGVVVEDAQGERLEIRPMMKVSLSADHRVLDGASGSRFLHTLKMLIEEPYLLL